MQRTLFRFSTNLCRFKVHEVPFETLCYLPQQTVESLFAIFFNEIADRFNHTGDILRRHFRVQG